MSDYINRESVLGVVKMLDLGCPKIYRKNMIDAVNSMIGIKVDTGDKLVNRTAKWIKSDIPNEGYICSSCGGAAWYYDNEKSVSKSRFCPNCGAEMDVR